MPDPRWITPEELKELMDRALYLLKAGGYSYEGEPGEKLAEVELAGVQIRLTLNRDVRVADYAAGVLVFDFDTRGIKECFGSTARNALLVLRENMVLDDLANV